MTAADLQQLVGRLHIEQLACPKKALRDFSGLIMRLAKTRAPLAPLWSAGGAFVESFRLDFSIRLLPIDP